jgi:2-oxoglutarate ferredoxin oxidoreductase subunit delta
MNDGATSIAGAGVDPEGDDRTTVLTRGRLVIDVEACKGCELCIDACPPRVLQMANDVNTRGYRYPLLFPGCTGCKACSQICPDFVFQVYKYDAPLEVPSAWSKADGPP